MQDLFGERIDSGAILSDDGLYRYRLWRAWGQGLQTLVFVMLNPSTADATKDDPTIRKCLGFARSRSFERIEVVNLFAYRATKPDVLPKVNDPIGPLNDAILLTTCKAADTVICAWGNNKFARARARHVASELDDAGIELMCLQRNADGSPMHPLYVPYDSKLERFLI